MSPPKVTLVERALALVSKRRPKGTPLSWGEAMLASVYVFGTMFLAFGIVPHQWILHSDSDLLWTKSYIIYGPGDIHVAHSADEWTSLLQVVECGRVLAAWLERELLPA